MDLYLKQKVFSWNDRFSAYDEAGNAVYFIDGEIFTLGKKLHISTPDGKEVMFIHQKVFSFRPKFFIEQNGSKVATIAQKFSFIHPKFNVEGPGWTVEGSITGYNFQIKCGSQVVATIAKKWLSWGDTYCISTPPEFDPQMTLAVTLVIDAVLHSNNDVSD